MATGDANDMATRLRAALPDGWFPDTAPVLGGILAGFGAVWAPIYSFLSWVTLQTRITTATGANLDLISLDFFGAGLPRRVGESDAAFEARIERELFRPKGTRAAVVRALTDLTGQTPRIFEPRLTTDTGGYTIGGIGYGAGGGYGSLLLPFQFFATAYFAVPSGIANVGGYYLGSGWDGGGWGVGALEYGDLAGAPGLISNADVYSAVNDVRPAATIAWTAIALAPVLPDPPVAPSGLAASAVTPTSMTLSWTQPASGGLVTEGYTIVSRVTGSGSFSTIVSAGLTGTSYGVTGLTPSTSYDFGVFGVNGAGPGPISVITRATPA